MPTTAVHRTHLFHTVLRQSEKMPMLYRPVKTHLFYINKYKLAQASKQRPETNCLFFLKSAHVSLKYKKIELLHCFKKNPAHIDNNKVVVSIKLLVHTHVYFI